jgi:hypothetical protein
VDISTVDQFVEGLAPEIVRKSPCSDAALQLRAPAVRLDGGEQRHGQRGEDLGER